MSRGGSTHPFVQSPGTIAVVVALIITTSGKAEEGETIWSSIFGGDDIDGSQSVIATSDSHYVTVGQTFSFGAGYSDVWMIKFGANGDSIWSRTFGGAADDWGSSVIETSNGNYLIAGTTEQYIGDTKDALLLLTDADGHLLWSRTYGGSGSEEANEVIETSDGGYLLTGYTTSTGTGWSDLWLLKTNSVGDSMWSRTYGWSYADEGFDLVETPDGGFLVVGILSELTYNNYQFWIVKLNSNGDSLWSRSYGEAYKDEAFAVAKTTDGCYLAAGYKGTTPQPSGYDGWVLKLDSNGDSLWSRSYGGSGMDWILTILELNGGDYLFAGTSVMPTTGYDLWIMRMSPAGDSVWSGIYHNDTDDWANEILQTAHGDYLVAGGTGGAIPDVWLVCVQGPGTAVQPQPPAQPASLALYPPRPNPFNAFTILSFELLAASQVSLRVYDTAGRPMETLLNSWRAAGPHEVTFDGSGLPSGIYIYRLTAGQFQAAGKVLLLK